MHPNQPGTSPPGSRLLADASALHLLLEVGAFLASLCLRRRLWNPSFFADVAELAVLPGRLNARQTCSETFSNSQTEA